MRIRGRMDEPCDVDTSINAEIVADSLPQPFRPSMHPDYLCSPLFSPCGPPQMQGGMHLPLNHGHGAVSNRVGRMIESHDALGLLR